MKLDKMFTVKRRIIIYKIQFTNCRAFFNIYTGGAKAPPAPMLAPPLKGFGPPSNVPFCLKMSENHAEIAGNQV